MIRRGLVGFPVGLAILGTLPWWAGQVGLPAYYLVLLTSVLFWAAQSTSWNVLSGYSGYFSFGQGAFVGVGAYTTAVLTGRHGVNFFLTLPVAAALSALLALAIGALAFRLSSLRGEIFALLTLAVPFILAALARISPAIDGGQGITVPVPPVPDWIGSFQNLLYLLDLLLALAAVAAAFAIQHSRFGWGLRGIRDAEDVAEVLGVPTFRYKLRAIVVSGLIGGIGGSTFALQIGFVAVDSVFGLTIPLFVIVMCVLGGRTSWLGPVLGAILIVTLQDRLATAGLEAWAPIILGAILALLIVIAPDGLYAALRARPLTALVTFVVVTGVLWILQPWGEVLDWLVAGMLAAAVVAIGARIVAARHVVPERFAAGRLVPARLRPGRSAGGDAGAPEGSHAGRFGTARPAEQNGAAALDGAGALEGTAGLGGAAALDGTAGPATRPDAASVLVDCRNVARYFGGVRALEDVTLQIRPGEIVGLVGPNGSGKTTMVNMLSGAFRPTRGTIRIAGRDIAGLRPHRIAHLGIARTYQIPRPFTSMTVRDNVAMAIMFGRSSRRLSQARLGAGPHLRMVALDHVADALPGQLNLHQRQLLEMARAVAADPKVLLLDEALAGLNPAEIDNAVQVVRRIHASGVTIVIVEHLLRVLNQLATRIVVLDRGTCLADGEPQAVMSDPAVVRAYLGGHAHA